MCTLLPSSCVAATPQIPYDPRTLKVFVEISFFRQFFFSIVAFSENNDLDFDAKLSNFFSGKPSVFDFHQFFILTLTHDLRRRVDLLFLRGYKTVFGPILKMG